MEKFCLPDKRKALENRALSLILPLLSPLDTVIGRHKASSCDSSPCDSLEEIVTISLKSEEWKDKISLILVDMIDLLSKPVTAYIFPLD